MYLQAVTGIRRSSGGRELTDQSLEADNVSFWIDPSLNSQIACYPQAARIANPDKIVYPVKAKRLSNLAQVSGGTVLRRAIVVADNVSSIAISGPPANKARRSWGTLPALTRTSGVGDVSNL